MKNKRLIGSMVLVGCLISMASAAEFVLEVPKVIPEPTRAQLASERSRLLSTEKTMKRKITKTNEDCTAKKKKDNPALEHKCSIRVHDLLVDKDKLNADIVAYNKKIRDALDQLNAPAASPASEATTPPIK